MNPAVPGAEESPEPPLVDEDTEWECPARTPEGVATRRDDDEEKLLASE